MWHLDFLLDPTLTNAPAGAGRGDSKPDYIHLYSTLVKGLPIVQLVVNDVPYSAI